MAVLAPANCRRWGGLRAAIAGALAVCGCTVGPDYERPPALVPQAYKELTGWKTAQPSDAADRGAWWSVFEDPILDALERQVEVSNQTLIANEAAFRQARGIVDQARASLYPTITGNASVRRVRSGSGGATRVFSTNDLTSGITGISAGGGGSGSAQTVYQPSVGAVWELDLWGRIRRTIESDVTEAQATAADVANAKLSLQAELASNYFQLRALDEQKALFDAAAAAYERSLQITQNQYRAGIATRADVVQAETQLASVRSQAIATGVDRARFEHAIAVLAGMPPADFSIPAASLPALPPAAPPGLPSSLLERRPDVAAAERRMASANALIGAAEAAYFPDVTITGSFGYGATSLGSLFDAANQAWSFGIALAEVAFDGGARRAVIKQARAGYDQAVANYRQTALQSFQNVEDQLAALRILDQQAAVQAGAVEAAREAERLELNRYKGGTVDYTSVVTVQQIALDNEQTALGIRQNRFLATVGLVQALGGGWTAAEIPAHIGKVIPPLY